MATTSPVIHDKALVLLNVGVCTLVCIWGLSARLTVWAQQKTQARQLHNICRAHNFHVISPIHVAKSRIIADCEGVWACLWGVPFLRIFDVLIAGNKWDITHKEVGNYA